MDLLINVHRASGKTTRDLQWTESEMDVLLFVELKLSYMPDQSQTMGEMAGMEVTVPGK